MEEVTCSPHRTYNNSKSSVHYHTCRFHEAINLVGSQNIG